MKKINELRARYPLVTIEEHEKTYHIGYSRSSAENVNKDNTDLEAILYYLNLRVAIQNLLEAEYPYLYFSVGEIPEHYHPNARGMSKDKCHIWLRRLYDYGENSLGVQAVDGTAVSYTFEYPPTDVAKEILKNLNAEAEKAQQEGWFFCTQCRKAYPKSEYGGYWFATTLCNECATPEWKQKAARETYD